MPTRPARTYGYARVSSRDQNLARQLDALQAFGIEERLVYTDKASGSDFERPESYPRVREAYLEHRLTRQQAAAELGVGVSAFGRWVKSDAR